MELSALILPQLQPIIETIDAIIYEEHPKILAEMAQELFAQQGAFNGRSAWEDNKKSTIKRKGGNSPNIETGFLENKMSTPGVLENDNWLDSIQSKKYAGNYKYADKLRKFSDIGKTPEDNKYIEKKLEMVLRDKLSA